MKALSKYKLIIRKKISFINTFLKIFFVFFISFDIDNENPHFYFKAGIFFLLLFSFYQNTNIFSGTYLFISGIFRCLVACSNANANLINIPSLYAVPANVTPKGLPFFIYPAGTAMEGYPAFAQMVEPI